MPQLPPVPNTPLRDDPTQDSIWKRWLQLLKNSYAGLGTVTSVTVSGGTTGLTGGGPITTSGTITLGGVLVGANGGTGVANTGKTITLGGNLTTTPANAITFTTTGATNVTLPTSGTLGTGSVTSVAQSFTGGLISVAGSPVTSSGTLALTVAGTSGGVPYFSGATTWASSGALAASAIVLGGGAGNPPATTATGTGVVTALGVNVGSAGAFVTFNGALGTPSSGTVTNLTGTASININGTVGATTPTTGAFTTIAASGNVTLSAGDLVFSASDPAIRQSTADGSDNARLTLAGGGAQTITRGAVIFIHGNERSSEPGNIYLYAGGVSTAVIAFEGSVAGNATKKNTWANSVNADWNTTYVSSTATSPFGMRIDYTGAAPNGTSNQFLHCLDNSGGETLRASIRSNGGLANFQANDANLSDATAKRNIRAAPDYTEQVKALAYKRFHYADAHPDDETDDITAQDLEGIAPELVGLFDEAKGLKGVYTYRLQQRINSVIPLLIRRIEALEEQLRKQ